MSTGRSFLSASRSLLRKAAATLTDVRQARRVGGSRARVVRLDDVRRRLELLVTAVYDRPIPITSVPAKSKRQTLASLRDALRAPHLRRERVLPTTDGERIQLPREIESSNAEAAFAEYRLMAIEQAERIARGTGSLVLPGQSAIERDLYLMREGEVIDAAIATAVPGLRPALASARAAALEARPSMSAMSAAERAVEILLRQSLSADLTSVDPGAGVSPAESLVWAQERMRTMEDVAGRRYRGVPLVAAWGTLTPRPPRDGAPLPRADELATFQGSKYGLGSFGRGSGKGGRQASEGGVEEGTSQSRRDGEVVLHNDGARRVATSGVGDTPRADTDGGHEETENTERTNETEPAQPESNVARDVTATRARRPSRASRVPPPKVAIDGIEYPEWDWEAGDYRASGAIVHRHEPDVTDDTWGTTILARHGVIVRRLRERFERLRARRTRLKQQQDGDELDLTACVRAWVDQRTGHTVDDRLYIAVRPARRGIAIALLIDISGSTDEWVDARRRVIDVEKIALLLASEALDALGDLYSILTFSGKGRTNVRMRTIKAFDETNGPEVRRRIGALEPEGYTRAGAAIRHAAAQLERQPAAHRLLLIISDGKPNDVDEYQGLRGVEDTRQAIIEARAKGVYPFCLTIDRQGQDYLGRIFGEAGHTILRNPQQLPMALVKVVKHLLAS
jgi:nitric oxide reductase NorD protein